MTQEHGSSPMQIEMFDDTPPAPITEKTTSPEKSSADRINQIKDLLTQEERLLLLRTTQQREEDTGDYQFSFGIPEDEAKAHIRRTLTEAGENGPSLLGLFLPPPTLRRDKVAPKKKSKNKLPLAPLPTLASPPPELYFCPNGINGDNKGIKIKPGITTEQFMERWNS